MSIGQWLADNLIPWALAGVAFVGSYSHLVALGQTHGVHGALAHTTAGCVDAIVAMASRERQRDKRLGRSRWGIVLWPVIVLSAAGGRAGHDENVPASRNDAHSTRA